MSSSHLENRSSKMEPLDVLSALVVRAPFDADIIPAYEAEGGNVRIQWNPTTMIERQILSGLRADVAIVTNTAMNMLIGEGIVDGATRRDLVTVGVGIAVLA